MSVAYNDKKHPYLDLGQNFKINFDYVSDLDEKHLNKAKEELRETPEIRDQGLKELRELINSEKNLVYPTDDFFLYPYLRPCKFYAKSAFKKLQKDLKFKAKHSEIFDNITVESVRNVFEDGIFKYTPLCDKDGQRILFVQCGKNWNLEKNSKYDLFRGVEIFFQAIAAEPMTQINGVTVLLDMEGLSMNHVMQISPSYAATILKWAQECLPVRLKQAYVVNNSKIFSVFWALFTPFISSKLKNRVHFVNQDFEALAGFMGKETLIKEYGGTLPVEYATGKGLVDFMKLHEKLFEIKNISGYYDEKDNIDEKRKKMNEVAEEVLNFVKTSSI
ncbi:alpha-tocopherol transfer protein-like [Chironomus tepperi]|uniref:alpha-tocopherol transfer protein-like n=1 Tax=Chironomus tepperi TaxID=113505 RepID=UPI00391F6EFC